MTEPTHDTLLQAAARIAPSVHRTPVLTCRSLDQVSGAALHFKCENFQRGGAFKIRGATNAVASLPADVAARGVATHSSGNHGAALAIAAQTAGVACHVVMPEDSVRPKVEAVRAYGAEITFCPPTMAGRTAVLDAVVARTGATFIHPYDDHRIIAGQATATLELLADAPPLDRVVVPIGGGGLAAGAALAAHHAAPRVRVVAAEPAGADDACRSLKAGQLVTDITPRTIADGLRATLGPKPFAILREHLDAVVTVEEASIVEAMRLVWQRMKIVIEPSAAVPLAAILAKRISVEGQSVGVIFSGGNVDLDDLPWRPRSQEGTGREPRIPTGRDE